MVLYLFSFYSLLHLYTDCFTGYVYLLFESEKAVRGLLQDCTHDFSSGDYYFKISSRRMRAKEVWSLYVFFARLFNMDPLLLLKMGIYGPSFVAEDGNISAVTVLKYLIARPFINFKSLELLLKDYGSF